jgi:hypothetical protein
VTFDNTTALVKSTQGESEYFQEIGQCRRRCADRFRHRPKYTSILVMTHHCAATGNLDDTHTLEPNSHPELMAALEPRHILPLNSRITKLWAATSPVWML